MTGVAEVVEMSRLRVAPLDMTCCRTVVALPNESRSLRQVRPVSPKNRDQIRTLQEKVKQALSDAGLLLENGSVEAAISRGYYAVFQAARAALEPLAPTAPMVLSTRRADAAIEVSTDFGFTGTTLVAADRITIGDRVLAGGNVSTVDFDVYLLAPEVRAEAVNAGAFVTQDVPPRTVAAGTPAQVVREV